MPETKPVKHATLADALAVAQGEMHNAPLNKVNPHFKSKYADLAAIRDATIPHLSKNGLSIRQLFVLRDTNLVLVTELCHGSEKIVSEYPLPNMPDQPQKMGSAITYAKRYSWGAMCGIAAEEDDDANAATTATNGNGAKPHPVSQFIDPKKEFWGGPLTKTELKEQIRQFHTDLESCEDFTTLTGLLAKSKALLNQCAKDQPSWWSSQAGSDVKGLHDRIEDRKEELSMMERA